MKRRICLILAVALGVCLLFSGCSQSAPLLSQSAFVSDLSQITVPDSVQIVGLGEASHGASELQQLKGEVFRALLTHRQCRVFALEGDFGGCAKVERYIHGGSGTAQEAVGEIGFRIYRTQEMAELVEWMRAYNETAAAGADLHFVGFDMQRYDNSKELLLSYLSAAAPSLAAQYKTKLQGLTDAGADALSTPALDAAESDLSALMAAMEQEIPDAQKDDAFAFALQCAQSLLENTQLKKNGAQYNVLRDAAMAKKVEWIRAHYEGLIFLTGHNGHIAQASVSRYECMGALLRKIYGDGYFSIGTDVEHCTFNGQNGDDYQVFTVENTNDLTAQLADVEGNLYYLDFSAVAQDAAWQDVLNRPQQMLGLNVSFSAWQKYVKMTHTFTLVPQICYHAVIELKTTSPTHFLDA